MTRLGAVFAKNLPPTQGSKFPSMHESPVVQFREKEVDSGVMFDREGGNAASYNKIHISKMAIAIAKAPATRPYLSFDQVNSYENQCSTTHEKGGKGV